MQTTTMPTFTKSNMPFAETNAFDKLLIDYINDTPLLSKFYSFEDSVQGVRERILTYKNARLNRKNLVKSIIDQYNISGIKYPDQNVVDNISLLESETTFTITTGHQLNIFSGPLYVYYKLITAINLAQSFKKLIPEYRFVPVYWMATEDHDMEEISSINFFGKTIKWDTTWKGMSGKAPVDNLNSVIDEISNSLTGSAIPDEIKVLMINSYTGSSNLADATRKWVNHLFGKHGLVIVDGNVPQLKSQFTDVISDELFLQTTSKLVHNSTAELKDNYHLQVNPREINLFYSGKNFRNRIISDGEKFSILNSDISFSKTEITEELKKHPENFSPNVMVRPLYQESVLPNVVYTGGPAEIAYWLELKAVFENYKVPMPSLFMRSSALIIDSASVKMMKKFSFSNVEIFKPTDELIKKVISNDENYSLGRITEVIATEMDRLSDEFSTIDPTLKATVDSEKQRISNSMQTLEQKIIRAAKKKNEIEVNRIKKLKDRLFPNGKLQEREVSVLSFLVNMGTDFIDMLQKNLDPLEKQFTILEEKEEQ